MKIKDYIKQNGHSINSLSKIFGMDRGYLGRIVNGERPLKFPIYACFRFMQTMGGSGVKLLKEWKEDFDKLKK